VRTIIERGNILPIMGPWGPIVDNNDDHQSH
jgi:hypothetical protein